MPSVALAARSRRYCPRRVGERPSRRRSGVDNKQASTTLERSDSVRADYVKRFYGVDEELRTHYDLAIDTDKLSPDAAAAFIGSAAG